VMSADADPGSVVDHNTVIGDRAATIDCSSKPGEGPSTTSVINNIASGGLELGGGANRCRPARNSHNLFGAGGRSPNRHGRPSFVGGADPSSYFGYRLARGSRGLGDATDGLNVGARIAPTPVLGPRGHVPVLASRPRLRTAISSRGRDATFTFTAAGASGYRCALVRRRAQRGRRPPARLRACRSPRHYSRLRPGRYVFTVRSADYAGVQRRARTRRFRIAR